MTKGRRHFSWLLPVEHTLSEEEIHTGYRWLVRDGVAAQAMASLHTGAFMVAFILLMGGSNFYVGLMAAIPFLTQFVQLPSIFLVERIRRRKAICVLASSLGRFLWVPLVALPLVLPKAFGLNWVVAVFFLSACLGAISNCSWNSWMRDFIPQERRGQLMSNRLRFQQGSAILVALAAAFLLSYWEGLFPASEIHGYLTVFLLGAGLGLLGVAFMTRIPEPRMPSPANAFSFHDLLTKPVRDENFRRLLWFLGSWSFAVNLAMPFFTVYMLQRLQLAISWVVVMSVVSTLSNMLVLNIWGRLTDKFSNKSVLVLTGPLFILNILAWPFTSLLETHMLMLLLLGFIHLVSGFSMAGLTLASGNIAMKLAPQGQATGYLVLNSLTVALCSGVATLLGGTAATVFATKEMSLTFAYSDFANGTSLTFPLLSLRELDFLFIIAVLIGFHAIHRLTLVKEHGEVKEEIVVKELFDEVMRGARHFTTVGGPVRPALFPFSRLIRYFYDSS